MTQTGWQWVDGLFFAGCRLSANTCTCIATCRHALLYIVHVNNEQDGVIVACCWLTESTRPASLFTARLRPHDVEHHASTTSIPSLGPSFGGVVLQAVAWNQTRRWIARFSNRKMLTLCDECCAHQLIPVVCNTATDRYKHNWQQRCCKKERKKVGQQHRPTGMSM